MDKVSDGSTVTMFEDVQSVARLLVQEFKGADVSPSAQLPLVEISDHNIPSYYNGRDVRDLWAVGTVDTEYDNYELRAKTSSPVYVSSEGELAYLAPVGIIKSMSGMAGYSEPLVNALIMKVARERDFTEDQLDSLYRQLFDRLAEMRIEASIS